MKLFISSILFLSMTLLTNCAIGQSKTFANADNIAINGYDLVAYQNAHQAVRGSKNYSTTLDGVTYYFSSAENATFFKNSPNKYLPAYGGYCAFAMAMKGAKVPSNPTTFKIRDGKLFLFFNDYYEGNPFNTIVPWNGDEANLLTKANTNWKSQK